MKEFYISLCRGFSGFYIKVLAPDEETVRKYATEYMGKLWCSIYTDAYFYEILRRRYPAATRVINRDKPLDLSSGWHFE